MQHLHRLLPQLQKKVDRFNAILAQHATEGKVLHDLSSWGVRLTLDFIAVSMFAVDFHCLDAHADDSQRLPASASDGQQFLSNLDTVLKEYTMRQPFNPLRKYTYLWNKEVREADRAARSLERLGQKLLDNYRATHTEEQLKADQSVLAYLIRSPYPSDRERIGDITTFLVAGHDTTGYQLSWTIIELAKSPRVVAKLRAELNRVLGPGDVKDITPDQVSTLRAARAALLV